jgi:hypothetical protein
MMNKDKLKENVGKIVRVQPPARGPFGEVFDDDWQIATVHDDGVAELEHLPTNSLTTATNRVCDARAAGRPKSTIG